MSKKVYIDPGHGGSDSGAVGVNNILEKDINLQVSKKVEQLLKKQGLEVKMSRYDDKYISLGQRATEANSWNANCFISIHCNAFNSTANGIETYAYNSSSKDLATDIQDELLKTKAYTLNRGIKYAGFYVLKNTKMKATLIELGFIDSKEDIKHLTQKQDELAQAIAKGICKYLKVEYKPINSNEEPAIPKPPVNDSDVFYRVVCGSYNNKVYAEEQVEKLKELGIENVFIAVYKKEE